jgi:hypothetical protein
MSASDAVILPAPVGAGATATSPGGGGGGATDTPSGAAAPNPGGVTPELRELQEFERELWQRLRECEKRLSHEEGQYIQNTGSTYTFGNIISGWEGLLEGKAPDKKRSSERIFSGA